MILLCHVLEIQQHHPVEHITSVWQTFVVILSNVRPFKKCKVFESTYAIYNNNWGH